MEDKDLLGLLRTAIERGDVSVDLDIRRQHHVDSPLYRVSDSSLAVYALMLLVSAIAYFVGWQAGVGAALVAGAIYGFGVRPWVASKMRQRLLQDVLTNPDDFRKAWKIKGLGFRHEASKTLCESPDGRWRSFVLETCAAGSSGQ